ncbi:aminopeptidase P family protein [symbiont of Argiope bruennichi]|uniref:aminopeptidase P family protein n=1 Tax=symbiont of Argiope bruennichi TaxID=2810479 RepID=UPI003DA312B4
MDKKKILTDFISKNGLDCLVISSGFTRFWLTNYDTTAGIIVATKDKNYFLADARYFNRIKNDKNCENIDEFILTNNYFSDLNILLDKLFLKNIGFEKKYSSYSDFLSLKAVLQDKNLIPTATENLRLVKSLKEIEKIRKACEINDKIFNFLTKNIKVGMTENFVKNLILQKIIEFSGDGPSFSPIVASGINSAFPHYDPKDVKIKEGDILLLDFGTIYQGYCCDMTRTIFVGNVNCNPNFSKLKEIYLTVKKAQESAISHVIPGKTGRLIDQVSRNIIKNAGYGDFFLHRTGHGLGIEVHELPNVADYDETKYQKNMVVTIEPGIYLENVGGVRIEDDVVCDLNSGVPLNKSPKELLIINN